MRRTVCRHRSGLAAGLMILVLASVLPGAPLSPAEIDCRERQAEGLARQVEELTSFMSPTPDLDRYRTEYQVALAARAGRPSPAPKLSTRLAAEHLVLLADTHTVPASQRRTCEVMTAMQAGGGELTLVIEWIDAHFQREVDAYLAGEVDLPTLRETVRFDETWGFSWRDYSGVLATARRLGVRVLLVESLIEHHSLARRDRDIARLVSEDRGQRRRSRYLIVYGGYHLLGRDHLGDRLTERGLPPSLVIVDEAREVYWRALRRLGDTDRVDVLALDDRLFVVRNGSPPERLRTERDAYLDLLDMETWELENEVDEEGCAPSNNHAARFRALHRGLE